MEQEFPQSYSMTLAIIPENERDSDPAAISAVGRIVVEDLLSEGYTVKPIAAGQKGGLELLFQIVTTTLQTVGTEILAQKDVIGILSDLCTIFGAASPLVLRLFRTQKKQPTKEQEIKVSIRIDETEIEVSSSDVANDERIFHLAERFLAEHPAANIIPRSTVKVQARVPKQKHHRR